jgi:hypothetical protein
MAAKNDALFIRAPVGDGVACDASFLPSFACTCERGAFAFAGPARCRRDDTSSVALTVEAIGMIATLGLSPLTFETTVADRH